VDLDSSDFKSNESFFRKDSQDQKSGFGFAERNAKSVLRSKIRFWIHGNEHTLNVETAATPLYDQETTTAQLQIYPCFPDRLVILNKDGILSFQTIRKRDFARRDFI